MRRNKQRREYDASVSSINSKFKNDNIQESPIDIEQY